jgi:hypothetical protein
MVNVQTQATGVNRGPTGETDEQFTTAKMGGIRLA